MIWAGIVLYYPDLERFKRNIEAISKRVDKVVLYDNGISDDVSAYLQECDLKFICLGDGNNEGIAVALNNIMQCAKNNNVNWVITLDQDSIIPSDYFDQVVLRLNNLKNQKIGIICPKVMDKRRIYTSNMDVHTSDADYEVDMCITSGSCTNVTAWDEVGRFDDYLFIDLVDNDFCKRLRLRGWSILQMGAVVLDQEYGNITPKSEKVVSFYRAICSKIPNKKLASNISKLAYRKIVNPLRVYYTNRNVIYLNKKMHKVGGIGYDCYNASTYIGFFICFNLASFFRAQDKIRVAKAIFSGIHDGIKSKVKHDVVVED